MDYDTSPPGVESRPEEKPERKYYYADPIRIMFSIAAVIMLVSSPFFTDARILSGIFVIFGIALVVLAGLTNRRLKTLFFINAITSLFIVAVLEFIALNITFNEHPFIVILTQIIALILIMALYYCLRTLRGFLFK